MTKIFITADNHFFHKNIIRYCNRPFGSVEEMNEEMIRRWNSKVGKDDIVLHLGDFAFRGRAKEIRDQLNGTIVIVRGNHDKYLTPEEGFIIVEGQLKIGKFIFTHCPIPMDEIPEGFINVFGHIHHNLAYSGICVCVEQTNYEPREIELTEESRKLFKV